MSFYSTEHQWSRVSLDQLYTPALASACNDDFRFKAAGWAETPASIEHLLLDGVFRTTLSQLASSGAKPVLSTIVASVYRCRIEERGAPRGGSATNR